MTAIDLILIGPATDAPPAWTAGPQSSVGATPAAVSNSLQAPTGDAVLCIDSRFPLPSLQLVEQLLDGPADAWHAGLRLGLGGQPSPLMHVHPQWMLTARVDPDQELTSPLLSPRALLVRRSVLDQLGGLDPTMETLTGAGLEMGIRWTRAGALVRHLPDLAPAGADLSPAASEADGHRCVSRHFGRSWAYWALGRGVLQRRVVPTHAPRILRTIQATEPNTTPFYQTPVQGEGTTDRSVSVILPTIDRYSFLVPLLGQLASQTVMPHEVLIVDQTPRPHRRDDLSSVVPGLPVSVIELDMPGQSTARNLALQNSTGELVLFLDDDDEIEPDLIEKHLRRLGDGIDAISGGVDDATAGPPPQGFQHRRASDVFPAGNTIVRRAALDHSGLFDPTFDNGPRADHDIGTRLHLSGAVLVYDPSVMLFHHHAPRGGLRTHGARATTRASSRKSLMKRNLPAATEIYLGLRYFTSEQRKEARAIRIFSTLSGDGPPVRRAARAIAQIVMLPDTLRRTRTVEHRAEQLLMDRSPIPRLPDL